MILGTSEQGLSIADRFEASSDTVELPAANFVDPFVIDQESLEVAEADYSFLIPSAYRLQDSKHMNHYLDLVGKGIEVGD